MPANTAETLNVLAKMKDPGKRRELAANPREVQGGRVAFPRRLAHRHGLPALPVVAPEPELAQVGRDAQLAAREEARAHPATPSPCGQGKQRQSRPQRVETARPLIVSGRIEREVSGGPRAFKMPRSLQHWQPLQPLLGVQPEGGGLSVELLYTIRLEGEEE